MQRIQLFEFEDLAWLPDNIRSSMTRLIVIVHRLMDTKTILASFLLRASLRSHSKMD